MKKRIDEYPIWGERQKLMFLKVATLAFILVGQGMELETFLP